MKAFRSLVAVLSVAAVSVVAVGCAGDDTDTIWTAGERPPLYDCTKDGQGFTGGATVPRQIFGSYGPGQSLLWDVKAGRTAGDAQNVQMATGFPNGIVTILWGEGAKAGANVMTVECTTGWGTYDPDDPSLLWQAGIIFDEIPGLGTNTYFCHHIEMDTSGPRTVMKMWESYWTYGEPYTCPATLRDALDGKGDFPNPITYLELPDTGIGAATVPPAEWTTTGTSVGVNTG